MTMTANTIMITNTDIILKIYGSFARIFVLLQRKYVAFTCTIIRYRKIFFI